MTLFCGGLAMFVLGWVVGIFSAAAVQIKTESQAIQDGYLKLNKEFFS
jgi:hypothetical protein